MGADEELSDSGSPRVIVYRYDGLPMRIRYIYPEYIPLEDEHVFLVEEQPLPPVDSPTAESPGYVVESDLEEDPEEYEDDESEKNFFLFPPSRKKEESGDYPMDGERK
ncbi:hypothetical protein Tco_1209952 [Tanacetum coccineum]